MGSTTGDRYDASRQVANNGNLDIRSLGFGPKRLKIQNSVNDVMMEWNNSMDADSWFKTIADGTRTFETSGGPSALAGDSTNPPGFRIPNTGDINDTTTEDLYWEAWG